MDLLRNCIQVFKRGQMPADFDIGQSENPAAFIKFNAIAGDVLIVFSDRDHGGNCDLLQIGMQIKPSILSLGVGG